MKRKGNFGGIFAMALILVLTLVLSVGSVSAAEPTIVDSGNCGKDGNNVTWTLDSAPRARRRRPTSLCPKCS